MWGRWFCASCNTTTGVWDEEYARWTAGPLVALHDPRNTGNRFSARVRDADPGAFVRCVWPWMFAIANDLRARYPGIASAVLRGEPAEPPDDSRLLLAATRDLQFGQLGLSFGITVTPPRPTSPLSSTESTLGSAAVSWTSAPGCGNLQGFAAHSRSSFPSCVPLTRTACRLSASRSARDDLGTLRLVTVAARRDRHITKRVQRDAVRSGVGHVASAARPARSDYPYSPF